MPTLDAATSALVLIDLQRGIAMPETAPRPGDEVVATVRNMAARFREAGAPVVLVHVGWHRDGRDLPSRNVDKPGLPDPADLPEHWSAFVDDLFQPGDITILKHQWGAFTGTELDLQLRRRGVKTVVVAGIATNLGVESTVRQAWEMGYDVVVPEDACASRSAEMHAFAVQQIFPLIARVVNSDDVALAGSTQHAGRENTGVS